MPERFLKIPHIHQRYETDCLVACAAMVLDAAGFRADYHQLMRLLGTTELGTPHSRVKQLARLHPEIVVIYEIGALEDIAQFLDNGYPVVVFVDTAELPYWNWATGHAVVIVGYSEQTFYLHDPEFTAPQSVSFGDLELARQFSDSHFLVVQRTQKPK